MSALIGVLMFSTALFLILLVLVQRGRGGGLSGALGGMGGQSAFGTKAGDLFTRITIVAATFWILLCIAAILILNRQSSADSSDGEGKGYQVIQPRGDDRPDDDQPADKGTKAEVPGGIGGIGPTAEKGAVEGDTAEKGAAEKGTAEKVDTEKVDTEKVDTEKVDTEKGDTEKGDTEKGDTEKGDSEKGGAKKPASE